MTLQNLYKENSLSLSYGILAAPLSLLGVTFYIYLATWYVSYFDASLSFIGISLMLSRIWDAITDPCVGSYSDKLNNLGFSRLFFISIGLLILVPSIYFLFDPQKQSLLSVNNNFLVFSFLFFLGLTLISIPYESIAIEYSESSLIRSKLITLRDSFFLLGTIGSTIIPYYYLSQSSDNIRENISKISYLYILILILSFLIFFRKRNYFKKSINSHVLNSKIIYNKDFFKKIFKKNFIILLLAFIISSLGAALPASLFLFFVKNYLNLSEAQGAISLFIYFVIGSISIPFWYKLSTFKNKKKLWFASQIINAGAFLPVVFLSSSSSQFFNFFVLLSGLGLGGVIILPSILQADYISKEVKNNLNLPIQGLIVGIWSIAKKSSQALGTGIAFLTLSFVGFNANSNYNTESAILTLGVLYSSVPSVLCLLSIFIARNYNEL